MRFQEKKQALPSHSLYTEYIDIYETVELVLNKRRLVPLSKANLGESEGITDRGSCASQCKGPKSSSATGGNMVTR